MLSLLVATALTPAVYKFEPGTPLTYTMKAEFNGFIPILGGNEGKVNVTLGMAVEGQAAKDGKPSVTSDINKFELKFNDAPLPFGLDSVKDFFPKATIVMSPQGKVLENSTPDRSLPVSLPGLDPKRLPDITFVPLELPADGIEVGKEWKFERQFGSSPIQYVCKVEAIEGSTARIYASISQKYSHLENDSLEVVKTEKEATANTTTTLTGKGTIWFNLEKGLPEGVMMRNDAVTKVTLLKGGATSERKLTTNFEIKNGNFEFPKVQTNVVAKAAPTSIWEWAREAGATVAQKTKAWSTTARLAVMMMATEIPLLSFLLGAIFGR